MFEFSKKSLELQEKLKVFMDKNVYPNESNITEEINSGNIWEPSSIIEELKEKATYVDPHQYSTGMKWVLVNGKIALKDGKKIDGRHGNVVRTKEG